MARRAPEKPLSRVASRARRARLAIVPLAIGLASASCYSTGDGSPPPLRAFYYPVGLQVSAGGTVLYAVNSDFDLQYNGGTLQSYDLALIRRHTLELIADPQSPERSDPRSQPPREQSVPRALALVADPRRDVRTARRLELLRSRHGDHRRLRDRPSSLTHAFGARSAVAASGGREPDLSRARVR